MSNQTHITRITATLAAVTDMWTDALADMTEDANETEDLAEAVAEGVREAAHAIPGIAADDAEHVAYAVIRILALDPVASEDLQTSLLARIDAA